MSVRAFSSSVLALLVACGPQPVTSAPTTCPEPATTPATAAAAPSAVAPRTIILVRHAEKVSDDRDAALSDVGRARAQCLAKVLDDVAVTHVLSTEFARTRDTVAPLAARRSLTAESIPADDKTKWLDTLRGLPPGAIAVVAGHSNSIPALAAELGADGVAIDHAEYDWMFVVSLPETGTPTVLRTHYCPA